MRGHRQLQSKNREVTSRGFTIVELLVVIAVVAILATIAIVSYSGWRHSLLGQQVQNDLANAAAAMKSAATFSDTGYPSSIPSSFSSSNGVTLVLFGQSSTTFCIDGVSDSDSTVTYYIDQDNIDSGPLSGTCATSSSLPSPGLPGSFAVTSNAGTTIGLSWTASSYASSYVAQCASDSGFVLGLVSNEVTSPTVATTITGLNAASAYFCRVKATNNSGSSAWTSVVSVNTTVPWSSVAGGNSYTSFGIRTDGSLWAWGENNIGQVGNGTTTNPQTTPVQIISSGVIDVVISGPSTSAVVHVLKSDGSVWGWGYNAYGQVGNGSTTTQTTPVQVIASGVTDIAKEGTLTYSTTYALKSDGSVWAWGYNAFGQVGNGSTSAQTTPVQVIASGTTAITTAGSSNAYSAYALKSDGSVWAWGRNGQGQVGNGSTTTQTTPVQVIASGVTDIKTAGLISTSTVYALKSDGSVWAWGHNGYGQVGNGSTTDQLSPVQVIASGATSIVNTGFSTSYVTTYVRKSDGSVWAWGYNGFGQVGNGTATTPQTTPVQVIASGATSVVTTGGSNAITAYALKSDGSVWAWGYNASGQVGIGNTTSPQTTPVQAIASGATNVVTGGQGGISTVYAVKSDDSLWAWGENAAGQVGNGSTADRSSPTQVISSGVSAIQTSGEVTNSAVFVIKTDGSLYRWGPNSSAQLGDGSTTYRTSPVLMIY